VKSILPYTFPFAFPFCSRKDLVGMAKKKKGGGKPRKQQAPRFFFEAGEKALNLPVRTEALGLNAAGEKPYSVAWQDDGVPAHLRPLGERVRLSALGADNKIIHGSFVEQARTFALKEDDDTVAVKLVGLPSTTVRVTLGYTLYYKDN
jgi:hypothetical protein